MHLLWENLKVQKENVKQAIKSVDKYREQVIKISKERKPKTFNQSKKIANQGGTIAGNTRKEIEEKTGKKIVTGSNAKKLQNPSKGKLKK